MYKEDTLLKADQANKLVYSSYEMTLNEKRLLMLAICKLSRDMAAFPLMYVKITDLRKYLEIEGTSIYTDIKSTCRRLLKRLVEIEDDKGRWIAHQWVSHCIIDPGTGILEIEIHKKLKPYLLQLENLYQSISFEHIAKIHKSHAIRLFEILWHKRNEKGYLSNTVELDFESLCKMLALGKSYFRFSEFKRRILIPSQKELEKSTPIRFTYETKKIAQKVISITFTVFNNDDYNAIKLPPMTAQMMLDLDKADNPIERKKVIVSTINKTVNHDVVYPDKPKGNKTLDEINASTDWAIDQIDKKAKTSSPVKNPAGYTAWAVENGVS